jgi:hypothetical protein
MKTPFDLMFLVDSTQERYPQWGGGGCHLLQKLFIISMPSSRVPQGRKSSRRTLHQISRLFET